MDELTEEEKKIIRENEEDEARLHKEKEAAEETKTSNLAFRKEKARLDEELRLGKPEIDRKEREYEKQLASGKSAEKLPQLHAKKLEELEKMETEVDLYDAE